MKIPSATPAQKVFSFARNIMPPSPQPLSTNPLDAEEADKAIARLVEQKFIDDARFARYFVKDKLKFNKWGRIKIGYALRQKGLP